MSRRGQPDVHLDDAAGAGRADGGEAAELRRAERRRHVAPGPPPGGARPSRRRGPTGTSTARRVRGGRVERARSPRGGTRRAGGRARSPNRASTITAAPPSAASSRGRSSGRATTIGSPAAARQRACSSRASAPVGSEARHAHDAHGDARTRRGSARTRSRRLRCCPGPRPPRSPGRPPRSARSCAASTATPRPACSMSTSVGRPWSRTAARSRVPGLRGRNGAVRGVEGVSGDHRGSVLIYVQDKGLQGTHARVADSVGFAYCSPLSAGDRTETCRHAPQDALSGRGESEKAWRCNAHRITSSPHRGRHRRRETISDIGRRFT